MQMAYHTKEALIQWMHQTVSNIWSKICIW